MLRKTSAIIVVLFLGAFALAAQEITGTILGTVTDSSGAVVPHAKVTVINTDRNTVLRTTQTDNNGYYAAPLLPIGRYAVTVAASGFKSFSKTDIELNVSDRLSVNAVLQPGSVQEIVSVEADALQVETQSPTAGGLINGTQIRELALSARNYEEMVALMPGVSAAVSDNIFVGVETPGGGTNEIDFSINGARFSQNNWTIDGADNVDRGGNFSLLNFPSVDAIAEFKVLRSLYSPEFGRGAGGEVDIVTRSGGHKFHGGLYEFFRNDKLNANRYLNKHFADPTQVLPRNPLRYNDFGGTFSGPVYIPGHYNTERNKTFFFFSEEVRRIITSSIEKVKIPNQNERNGIFPFPVCTSIDIAGGTPCPTASVISPASFNPAAAAYLKDIFSHIPLPQDPVADSLIMNGKNQFNYRQEIIRVDHSFSPKLMVTGRWMNDSIPTLNPAGLFGFTNVLGYATSQTNSPGKNLLMRGTWTIKPTLLNEMGYAWSSGGIVSTPVGTSTFANSPDVVKAITLPIPSALPRIPNLAFGQVAGLAGFGPYRDFNINHNWFDNLTFVHGPHTLKFGFSYNRYQKNENDAGGNPSNGQFGFYSFDPNADPTIPPGQNPTAAPTLQQEWASFLLGNVQNFRQAKVDFHNRIRQHSFEAFAQDEVRLRRNLTLTFGLRYTYYGQPTDDLGRATNFDPKFYDPNFAPQLDSSGNIVPGTGLPLNGIIITGPSPNPDGAQRSPFKNAVAKQTTTDVAPRFGLAWDPFGNGKTSIRTGFGMFYDSPAIGFLENNLFINPPFVGTINITNTVFDNPGSTTPDVNTSPQFIKGVATNWHLPYTEMWSFDVQQELPMRFIVDVGYYGSTAKHLIGVVDINQPQAGAYRAATGIAGPIDGTNTNLLSLVRPFQGYGPINVSSPSFSSNYHSLQASLEKHFRGGAQINLNYTWSHDLTNAGNDFATPQQNTNLRAEYGPADFDRRHVFDANFVYEFPWMKSQRGVIGHLVGGWEFSGIITYNSGLLLTAHGVNTDPAGLGLLDPSVNNTSTSNFGSFPPGRPDQIGFANVKSPHTAEQWFNILAFGTNVTTNGVTTFVPFEAPANGNRPGNARRGTIQGPGIERWDLSLFKNIKVTEGSNFQFRLETFNVLNHTNFQQIDTNATGGSFGQVLSVHEPRILQLGLKYNF